MREIAQNNKLVTCVLVGHMLHQSPLFILVREQSCKHPAGKQTNYDMDILGNINIDKGLLETIDIDMG